MSSIREGLPPPPVPTKSPHPPLRSTRTPSTYTTGSLRPGRPGGARGQVQLKLPQRVGERAEVSAGDEHTDAVDGSLADGIRNSSTDGARPLRGDDGRTTQHQTDAPREDGPQPTKGRPHLRLLVWGKHTCDQR